MKQDNAAPRKAKIKIEINPAKFHFHFTGGKPLLIYLLILWIPLLAVSFAHDPDLWLESYIRAHGVTTEGRILGAHGGSSIDHGRLGVEVIFNDLNNQPQDHYYRASVSMIYNLEYQIGKGKDIPVTVTYLPDHPWLLALKDIPNKSSLTFEISLILLLPFLLPVMLVLYIFCRPRYQK